MKILYISLGLLSLISTACANSDSNNIIEQLSIQQDAKTCTIKYKGKKYALKTQPPCYFFTQGQKKPKTFSFPDANVDHTMVVIGGKLTKKMYQDWGLTGKEKCGTTMQGVLISGKTITPTKTVIQDGVFCQEYGIDQKIFWQFAHDK